MIFFLAANVTRIYYDSFKTTFFQTTEQCLQCKFVPSARCSELVLQIIIIKSK